MSERQLVPHLISNKVSARSTRPYWTDEDYHSRPGQRRCRQDDYCSQRCGRAQQAKFQRRPCRQRSSGISLQMGGARQSRISSLRNRFGKLRPVRRLRTGCRTLGALRLKLWSSTPRRANASSEPLSRSLMSSWYHVRRLAWILRQPSERWALFRPPDAARAAPLDVILVPNRADQRTLEGQQLEQELRSFGEMVAPTVSQRSAFVRAFATGQSVV